MQPFKCSDREVVFASGKKLTFAYLKENVFKKSGTIEVKVQGEDALHNSPQIMKVENFDAILIVSSIVAGCIYMIDKKTGLCVKQF